MASRRHSRYNCAPGCVVEGTLSLIDGKWKGVILFHLMHETLRFNALKRRMPNVTQRMLINQLRGLEQDGFVARKVYPQVPPRVEYSLTPLGESLEPVIEALKAWGDTYLDSASGRISSHASDEKRVADVAQAS